MRQGNDILSAFAEVVSMTVRVDPAAVTPSRRLREDLGIDSLSLIDVAVAVEDAFGVRIPDDDLEQFDRVGDFVDFIEQARAAV
jgi:acyl carrier protein